jgi:hypothetical protein
MNPEQIKALIAEARSPSPDDPLILLLRLAAHCEALLTENERMGAVVEAAMEAVAYLRANEDDAALVVVENDLAQALAALAGSPPEPGDAP